MMKHWNCNTSLKDMKNYFDSILTKAPSINHVYLRDLITLSSLETEQLYEQLFKIDSIDLFNEYCICVIIGWESSFVNNYEDAFHILMAAKYFNIPQHARRKYLEILQSTFEEYGLDTFNNSFSNLNEIEQVIRYHARTQTPDKILYGLFTSDRRQIALLPVGKHSLHSNKKSLSYATIPQIAK